MIRSKATFAAGLLPLHFGGKYFKLSTVENYLRMKCNFTLILKFILHQKIN